MRRPAVVLVALAALFGSATTAQASNPKANLRTVELAGTIAVEGTPSAQKPIRFTARLIADTAGVPLQRGGRAVITDGRINVNTIGTVVSACLAESSLGLPYFMGPSVSAKTRYGTLRTLPRRRLALDLDVVVDSALRGFVGPDCSKATGVEANRLRLRGTLGPGSLAPVRMSATTAVTLQDGRRAALRVTTTATIRRYLPPS